MANEVTSTNIGEAIGATFSISKRELEAFTAEYIAGMGYTGIEVGVRKRDDDTVSMFAFIPANSNAFAKNNSNISPALAEKLECGNKTYLTKKAAADFFPLVFGCEARKDNDYKNIKVFSTGRKGVLYIRLDIFAVLELAVNAGNEYHVRIAESGFVNKELILAVTKNRRINGKNKSSDDWKERAMAEDERRRF